MSTPLLDFLRAANEQERSATAALAGTSVGYLYQVATCVRPRPSAILACAIEDATREMQKRNAALPIVTVRELATMCAVAGL
jgi:hypothetical protein